MSNHSISMVKLIHLTEKKLPKILSLLHFITSTCISSYIHLRSTFFCWQVERSWSELTVSVGKPEQRPLLSEETGISLSCRSLRGATAETRWCCPDLVKGWGNKVYTTLIHNTWRRSVRLESISKDSDTQTAEKWSMNISACLTGSAVVFLK